MATATEAIEPPLRIFAQELPVKLTDDELQSYGKMLADKVQEEQLAVERKQQITKQLAGGIATVRNEISRIADARAKGQELRPVQCYERFKNGVIEIVRTDSNEIVSVRPADLRDLQTTIPGTDDDFDPPSETGPAGELHELLEPHDGGPVTSSMGDTVHVMPDDDDNEEIVDKEFDDSDAPPDTEADADPFDQGGSSASPTRHQPPTRGNGKANGKAKASATKKSAKKKR